MGSQNSLQKVYMQLFSAKKKGGCPSYLNIQNAESFTFDLACYWLFMSIRKKISTKRNILDFFPQAIPNSRCFVQVGGRGRKECQRLI